MKHLYDSLPYGRGSVSGIESEAPIPSRDRNGASPKKTPQVVLTLCCLVLTACNSTTAPTKPSIGKAFAGPHSLNLRKDLGPKAPAVATLKHGELVEILETRRRFVKVRTGEGVEGWTDQNLLLTPTQMAGLRRLAENAKAIPSQGTATVFDTLNMHIDPNRQSPSFYQVTEGIPMEVIGHRVSSPHDAVALPTPPVRRTAPVKKKSSKEKKVFVSQLPVPHSTNPPANWMELSRPRVSDLNLAPKPPVPGVQQAAEDWSLVRLRDGQVGWVVTRMLNMSLPDEVAQYAEGRRITAYLPLGEIKDKTGTTKQNWLWTTQSAGVKPYDFDSFRVFVWSTSRHRYETALIERNVKGFYPIELQNVASEDGKGFSIVLEDKDGQLYRRIYAFSGYRVRIISKTPYQRPADFSDMKTVVPESPEPTEVAQAGWRDRIKDWWTHLRAR